MAQSFGLGGVMAFTRFFPNIFLNMSLPGLRILAARLRTTRHISRVCGALWLYCFCVSCLAVRSFSADTPPPWTEVHAKHFVVTTDAGEKQGREVAFRVEQMRAVFGSLLLKNRLNQSVPVAIIALKDDGEYARTAPSSAEELSGFMLRSEDRAFIVLNLSKNEPWRAIAHDFASFFLTYNYPPTQDWFDEGCAEYFSSIRLNDKQIEMGSEPEHQDSSGSSAGRLTQLLNASEWMSIPDLFAAHLPTTKSDHENATLFHAQSWMVVHYILNKNLLQQTGNYFELVQNQKVPVEQAVTKAVNMSSSQFGEAVKTYYRSRSWLAAAPAGQGQAGAPDQSPVTRFPSPLGPDDFGMTVTHLPALDARALLADARARVRVRHEQGLKDLKSLASDPSNNQIAHRALAWAFIEEKNFEAAVEELGTAAELNQHDPWVRYYLSVLKYRIAQTNHQSIQGLANMMQDLRAVVDWYPEFAEAYNMLAMARVEGGGPTSALEAIRAAIQLSPRNEEYLYNLGLVYALGKKWDAARAIFEKLSAGTNPQLAAQARDQLSRLQTVQKYGIAAASPAAASPPAKAPQEKQSQAPAEPPHKEGATPDTNDAGNPTPKPDTPAPMSGPILFAKGRLLSVDCSKQPVAFLKVVVGGKTLELRTADYKSLPVIGEDSFSCAWGSRTISVNYRASGKGTGELVSVEVQ